MEKIINRQPSVNKKRRLKNVHKTAILLLASILVLGLLSAEALGYTANLQTDIPRFQVNAQVSITQLYQNVEQSVVVITDLQPSTGTFGQTTYTPVQGSGFVYNLNGQMIIVTNFHVIHPLEIASSSSLQVGDFVAALGSPFGLSGSITTGIVSQLGRTITESTAGNFPIANVIQTDAPINPGNSGGPLLNDQGQVVGINTAGVSGSQGVGFAIPSDTILKEINDLVQTGTYTQHAYMGISGVDNTYDIASQTGLSATYGVLIQQVVSGGPAAQAGLRAGTTTATVDGATLMVGGDLIIAINNTRIINNDALSTYLEQKTLPNQQVTLKIIRNGQTMDIQLTLGTRPPPSGFTPPSPQPSTSPPTTQSPTPSASSSPAIPETTTSAIAAIAAVALVIAIVAKKTRRIK
jgi:S1-C subfamily serine protease